MSSSQQQTADAVWKRKKERYFFFFLWAGWLSVETMMPDVCSLLLTIISVS
jgi:hypothetical protein